MIVMIFVTQNNFAAHFKTVQEFPTVSFDFTLFCYKTGSKFLFQTKSTVHTWAHTPNTAFRHLPPWRKYVVNHCLEFDMGLVQTSVLIILLFRKELHCFNV